LVRQKKQRIRFLSGYFWVPKGVLARTIFNEKRLSRLLPGPPPVRLAAMPEILNRSCWAATAGSCWFHQLRAPPSLQSLFGPQFGSTKYCWTSFPSWSPWLAKAVAWSIVSHREKHEPPLVTRAGEKRNNATTCLCHKAGLALRRDIRSEREDQGAEKCSGRDERVDPLMGGRRRARRPLKDMRWYSENDRRRRRRFTTHITAMKSHHGRERTTTTMSAQLMNNVTATKNGDDKSRELARAHESRNRKDRISVFFSFLFQRPNIGSMLCFSVDSKYSRYRGRARLQLAA
jgi:hypothetical protein